jgi:Ser/Thr protein kinase RdoA (MazF antagonist)
MNTQLITPNAEIAAFIVTSMTNEEVLSSIRMTTGEQYFVFDIKTSHSKYVLRMTDTEHRNNFVSAIYWQEKLIPLGIPLAKFIQSDLDGEYSQFPALLMRRLPGDDLCNIYSTLSDLDKKTLAQEMVAIQSATNFPVMNKHQNVIHGMTF